MPMVSIAPPTPFDAEEFLAAVARSRSFHANWVQPPATKAAYAAYVTRAVIPALSPFLIRRADDNALAGVVNLSNVIGEPLSSAFLGFYTFEPHARRGYMQAGLRLVLSHAFSALNLHRVEANIQPANQASIELVRKLGFRREGYSPKYLRIAGEWRDHEHWALLDDEFPQLDH